MYSVRGFALLFLGVTAVFVGCASQGDHASQVSPEASLRQTALAWAHSFTTRDPNEILTYFADDAIAWYPKQPRPITGRDANFAAWTAFFKSNAAHPVSVEHVEAATSGELGVTYGKYLYKESTDPGAEGGRYVAVWRKLGHGWRIVLLSAHKHDDVSGATFEPLR
jgi:ketosteroid isomerase-like protein